MSVIDKRRLSEACEKLHLFLGSETLDSLIAEYGEDDHPYHEACPKCWSRFEAMRRRAERAERRAFVLEGALDLLIDFARDYDPDGSATGPALDVLGGRVK